MPQMIPKNALAYGGVSRPAGEPFQASARDARVLVVTGLATYAPDAAEATPAPKPRTRGRYKRRDMQAEG